MNHMPEAAPMLAVAVALDEAFAMPAATMLASLIANLGEGTTLEVFLLEDRVSNSSKERIDSILAAADAERHWLAPRTDVLTEHIPPQHSPAAYFSLLLPDLAPKRVERVVCLDADLIVLGDLTELWRMDLQEALVLATHDAYATNKIARLETLEAPDVPQFQGQAGYFNAGVMLIDLAGWRRQAVGRRSLELIAALSGRIGYYEQDALNLVLNTRWSPLPGTWNFHEMSRQLDLWEWHRYPARDRAEMFRAPKIVHFIFRPKPWHVRCVRAHVELFRDYLALTPWKDEQPRLEWHRALFAWIVRRPHERVRWHYWRLRQSPGWDLAGRLAWLTLLHPWIVLSLPLEYLIRRMRRSSLAKTQTTKR